MQEIIATVAEVIKETPTVKTIKFEEFFPFRSGDHLFVAEQKPLSISSSPTEGFLQITKKITDSEFSRNLNSLQVGDKLTIEGPLRSFPFSEQRNALMLSGGIGITPLRSMIKYAFDKELPIRIVLLYSNKEAKDIPFFGDMQSMINDNIKIIHTLTEGSWQGRQGRIDEKMIREFQIENPIYYSCGPPKMVEVMTEILRKIGIDEDNIKIENFTGY